MENFRIWYQRGSDILKIRFTHNDAISLEYLSEMKYQHGLVYTTSEHDGETTITCIIVLFSMSREKILKYLQISRLAPVENIDRYIDLVMQSHPNLTSTCYDFYLIWDGTWQELDLTYSKICQGAILWKGEK